MKYRITPGNVLVLIMVSYAIYFKITSTDPNTLLGAGYLLFYSIFIFLGDLFLQYIIGNYKRLLLIEGIAVPLLLIIVTIT